MTGVQDLGSFEDILTLPHWRSQPIYREGRR